MGSDQRQIEFDRLYEEITELRQCKQELATLKEFKTNSEDKFREIKDNIEKLFNKIEGNGKKGIKDEIGEIKSLLTKFDDNINEVYDRIEKIEALLERTINEVHELTPTVRALMNIENERKEEKNSFRREFRLWIIGFIGTVILTAIVTWVNINSKSYPSDETIKSIINQTVQQQQQYKK